MSVTLRVLIVEDSVDDAELVTRHVRHSGYDLVFMRVETAAAMKEALAAQSWDIILSDYSMPQFSAPRALAVLKEQQIDIPFIIVSGTIGEETAVAALLAGANDFLVKGHLSRLIPAIERELREAQERRNRKKAEEELRRAEERFSKAFQLSPIPISITTGDEGRYIDVNDGFLKMSGYSREEVIGRTFHELDTWVHPDDRAGAVTRLARQQTIRDWEVKFRTKSGEIRETLASLEGIHLDGTFCVLMLLHDITERKHDEEVLRRYNQRLTILHTIDQTILGARSVQAVAQLALRYFLQEVSLPAVAIVAFDFEAKTGTVFAIYRNRPILESTPLSLDEWSQEDLAGLKTGAIQIVDDTTVIPQLPPGLRILHDNGLRVFIRVPLFSQGELLGTLNLAADETNTFSDDYIEIATEIAAQMSIAIRQAHLDEQIRRYATELEQRVVERTVELQRTKERVEAILNNSGDAILFVTPDGVIQQVNPAFQALFGFPTMEIFGQSLSLIARQDEDSALLNALRASIETDQPSRLDFVASRNDGSQFDADMAIAAIRQGDTIRGLVCNVRDITARKQAEIELRQALEKERELNELKSRFVSIVSHEFRTPLTAILSSSQLLKLYRNRMNDERQNSHLEGIETQVRRLTELLEDVLTFSKSEVVGYEFNPKPLDLGMFCSNLAEEIQVITKSPHEIVVSVTGECAGFIGDEKLLRQIIINLLTNAIKYSPAGGKVELVLTCEAGYATIQVKDGGLGIPPEDQKHLFEPFHRARNVGDISGTGLGLPIVKRAVEAHNGTMNVQSEVGVGTTFTVTIPLHS